MFRRLLAALVVFAFFLNVGFTDAPKSDDAKKIQGTWKVVSISAPDGSNGPSDEELKKFRLKVTATQFIMVVDGREDPGKYSIDPLKKPKSIDLFERVKTKDKVAEGKLLPGIYELSEDTLKICLPIRTRPARKNEQDKQQPFPSAVRPTEFKASEKTIVMIFKRDK